jgi:CheY-like chemotaxis protein
MKSARGHAKSLQLSGTVPPNTPFGIQRPQCFKKRAAYCRNPAFDLKSGFSAWQTRKRMSMSAENGARMPVILVVEDEFLVRYSVADRLRSAGYAVVEAANAEEAIALCRSDAAIDLLFTDINLVGSANGLDVAECFRSDRPNAPVLYTSGKAIDRQRCVPGSVFFAKPYDGTEIVQTCEQLRTK